MTAALSRSALVLNKRWVPIQLATMKEAISLVAKGHAMIVEPGTYATHDILSWNDASKAQAKFGDAVIRSCKLALVPPEVIVLTQYDGQAQRSVVFSRKNLFKRDKYTCQYCGVQPGPEELTMDHILPRSKGGVSSWENTVLACIECNKVKADKTPEEAGMRLRKVPRKPSWTKIMAQIHPRDRKESWEKFLSRAYWEVELEP